MPFDSNGVWSLTPGYLAVTGQVVSPTNHNPPLEDISTNGLSAVMIRDGRAPATGNWNMGGFRLTNLGKPTTAGDAQTASIYSVKAGNYTAVAADANSVIRFSASATLALPAAATFGANSSITVIADGGTVAVDPNGSETINGALTLTVQNGTSAKIICDGSNFFTVFKPAVWEPVGTGFYSGSGAANFSLTDLGAYKRIKITGTIFPSVASGLALTTSSNNGSSYDTGASDYVTIVHAYQAAASSVTTSTTTTIALSLGANVNPTSAEAAQINVIIERFNEAAVMKLIAQVQAINVSGIVGGTVNSIRNQATARNAFRIGSGSGTITYSLLIEGSRV